MLKITRGGLAFSSIFTGAVLSLVMFAPYFVQHTFAFNEAGGKKTYEQHCAMCHGEDGMPVSIDTPDFTMQDGLMKSDRQLVEVILNGIGVMPAYRGIISEEDIRDTILYIRFKLASNF